MYFHIRLDKILYEGHTDMDARIAWNFRSLGKALAMVGRDFRHLAQGWRIEYITENVDDPMLLLPVLQKVTEDGYQTVVMPIRNGCAESERYDHYEFFVVARDETERPPDYSYSEEEESSILENVCVPKPSIENSLKDVLRSFDASEDCDFVEQAIEMIIENYGGEKDAPQDVLALKDKEVLHSDDYVLLGEECQWCGDDQFAARSFAAAVAVPGDADVRGDALINLAQLYMVSDWPKNGGREWDVMKAVDLLTEALSLGCVQNAKDALDGMRSQIFCDLEDEFEREGGMDDEQLFDVDYCISHYEADALCLAAFCLAIGVGWKKDVATAIKLYEVALSRGYARAAYYLGEISDGHLE